MALHSNTGYNRIAGFVVILVLTLTIIGCRKTRTDPDPQMKALIIDGQNNHYIWPKTTQMLRDYLEQTELFTVDISRTSNIWLGIKYNPNRPRELDYFYYAFPLENGKDHKILDSTESDMDFNPDFKTYDVVVLNIGETTANWPATTRSVFIEYLHGGGGLVVVHASNNPWGDWEEFNTLIGLGGWGGRDSISGPYVYYDKTGKLHRDSSAGICASHGLEQEYVLTIRDTGHPITKGLPKAWLHTRDELYDRLRGPAKNLKVLATAYSDVEKNRPPWNPTLPGTGRHEPMLMTIDYGKGRVFHTTLGHWDYSMECVGFITTLQRGAEWAATGKVTQRMPTDFPTANKTSKRIWDPGSAEH